MEDETLELASYSSISHMSFVLIGIGSMTDLGLNGAILPMNFHRLIGAALLFLAGISYDRTRTLFLDQMGGIAIYMPKIFTIKCLVVCQWHH